MLQPDFALVAGLLLIVLAIPSFLAALADQRRPGVAVLLTLVGGGLAWWAWTRSGGYAPGDVPLIVIELVARVIN